MNLVSGAEYLSRSLVANGVEIAFTYPGTSELSICDALVGLSIQVANSYGDSQAVFLSSGYNYFNKLRSVCVLHGVRGLTNALGAIGVAKRNEIPLLVVVGMPSMNSQGYLPPHGENEMIANSSWLAKDSIEVKDRSEFISYVERAIAATISEPFGPVILGIPQNLLEEKWINIRQYNIRSTNPRERILLRDTIELAISNITCSTRIVILIDDICLRDEENIILINLISKQLNSNVYQVQYKRGPMLFKTLTVDDCRNFSGWIDNENQKYHDDIYGADLIITIEDRNMYPRVVGKLPECKKIVITSNKMVSLKNRYTNDNDIVIEGSLHKIIRALLEGLQGCEASKRIRETRNRFGKSYFRDNIVVEISKLLKKFDNPIIVDDSQSFGGIISKQYHLLPRCVKVFGDHSAFVGAGISHAVGVSLAFPEEHIVCFLGDHGFINGLQGLVAASQLDAKVIFIVCNNGGSYTLKKQLATYSDKNRKYLDNAKLLSYTDVASAYNTAVCKLEYDKNDFSLVQQVEQLIPKHNRVLVELLLPDDPKFWQDIWETKGRDEPRH